MPIVPSLAVGTNIVLLRRVVIVQNINISEKSQISVFPGFGQIEISPKKSSDNVQCPPKNLPIVKLFSDGQGC